MITVEQPKTLYQRMFAGEVPSHKLYEDDVNGFLAFLDIKPATKGHTLVVPWEAIDKVYELEPARTIQFSRLTQIISQRLQERLHPLRVTEHVYGFQVPHAHRMLVPSYERGDVAFLNAAARMEQEPDHAALASLAGELAFTATEQAATRAYIEKLGALVADCT